MNFQDNSGEKNDAVAAKAIAGEITAEIRG